MRNICIIMRNIYIFTDIYWGPAPTLSSFSTLRDTKVIARFLRECFKHRNSGVRLKVFSRMVASVTLTHVCSMQMRQVKQSYIYI